VNKDLTPLLSGSYILLASPLKDVDGGLTTSLLHQVNLSYSVSNESDVLFSFQFANGRGLNTLGKAQSAFCSRSCKHDDTTSFLLLTPN